MRKIIFCFVLLASSICFADEKRGPNLLGIEFDMPFGIYRDNKGMNWSNNELFLPVPYIRYSRLLTKNLELGAGIGYHYYIFNSSIKGSSQGHTNIKNVLLTDITVRYNFELSKRWGLFVGGGPVAGAVFISYGPGYPTAPAIGFKARFGAHVWVAEWVRLNMGLEYQMGWWNGQQWNVYYLPNFFVGVDFGF